MWISFHCIANHRAFPRVTFTCLHLTQSKSTIYMTITSVPFIISFSFYNSVNMGKSILPYCSYQSDSGYQYKIKKLTTYLLSLLPSIISADLSENRRLLQRVEEVVFSDLWYNGVLIHVGFCCAWRLVVCDHNYNWRQRKTQLGIQLFNFRVRVLLKSAVIKKLIIKLLLLNYHVRPPIKIPQLNTTFPIKVLLSKPVVTDSFRICKWPWIILRWPVPHFPSFNSASLLFLPDMARIPQQRLPITEVLTQPLS